MVQDLRTLHRCCCRLQETGRCETNVAHLTQEKHPTSQQILSEVSDSASIQEVGLQTIEATGPTESRDGQEAYEWGLALKNAGRFRQAPNILEAAQGPAYALKYLAQRGLNLKKMENRKRPWRLFVVRCKFPRHRQKSKYRFSTS